MKYLQNRIAESRQTLSAVMVYSAAVWLLAGLIQEGWWIQFVLFVASVFMMMTLSNTNLLIRIYSRLVSVSFAVLSCAASFLFPSVAGAFVQLCVILSIFSLFNAYQEQPVVGWIYYAFLFLSLASLAEARMLWFLPLLWFLMLVPVHARGGRALTASVLGILTPYWAALSWLLFSQGASLDISLAGAHFGKLADSVMYGFDTLGLQRLLVLLLAVALGALGGVHFILKHFEDRYRVRQLYYSFIYIAIYSCVMMIAFPSQFDLLLRVLIIAVSPLAGHFFALTKTKASNICFLVTAGIIFILTVFNLWTSSSVF